MFKALFKTNTIEDSIDAELEATMRTIHARMDRMLEREHMKQLRFNTIDSSSGHYR